MVACQWGIVCFYWWCDLYMISQAAFSSTTSQRLMLLFCLLFRQSMSHIHRRQFEIYTNPSMARILVARVMFLAFQIFESVEAVFLVLAIAILSPIVNRASTILDNHWSKEVKCVHVINYFMIVFFFHLEVESELLTCSLHPVHECQQFYWGSCHQSGVVGVPWIGNCPQTEIWPSGLSTNRNLTLRFIHQPKPDPHGIT